MKKKFHSENLVYQGIEKKITFKRKKSLETKRKVPYL